MGAGPKGLAIAAKQAVLRRLGIPAPDVVLLDRHGVAAHWSGEHGYTDGRRFLGTAPEKDVGFPYDSRAWGDAAPNRAVDRAMLDYSWHAHLVETYRYAAWIDRGRVRPTHEEWSAYLRWVADVVQPRVVVGELTGLHVTDRRWRVCYRDSASAGEQAIAADGVVLTGPGHATRVPGQPDHPRVLDGATVWQALDALASPRASRSPLRIGVIGSGETAAAAVVALIEVLRDGARIDVVLPHGVLYTRDEGYEENRLFSDPDPHDMGDAGTHRHARRWLGLTVQDRREFVRRADRGVFSVQAVLEIARAHNVRTLIGTASALDALDDEVRLTLTYGGVDEVHTFDYVVVAIGFDPLWFLDHLSDEARVPKTPRDAPSEGVSGPPQPRGPCEKARPSRSGFGAPGSPGERFL